MGVETGGTTVPTRLVEESGKEEIKKGA